MSKFVGNAKNYKLVQCSQHLLSSNSVRNEMRAERTYK